MTAVRVAKSKMLPREHINAMCKALKASGADVKRTDEGVIAKMRGVEVFRSLKVNGVAWLTRWVNGLFKEDGLTDGESRRTRDAAVSAGGINRVKANAEA